MYQEEKSFYGWKIVAVCATIALIVSMARNAPFTFFPTGSLEDRQSFGMAVFFGSLLSIPLSLLIGWYVDKVGSKKLMLFGCLLAGTGIILFAAALSHLWLYAVLSFLIGAGASAASHIPITVLLLKWFKRSRGIALALVSAATGAGYAIMTYAAAFAREGLARQISCILIGIATLAIAILFIRQYIIDHPSEMGLHPDGFEPAEGTPPEPTGHTYRKAVRTSTFWYIVGALFLVNVFSTVPIWMLIGDLMDAEVSRASLSSVIDTLQRAAFLFIPFIGLLADRRGATRAFVLIVLTSAVGVGVLAALPASWIYVGLPLLQQICGVGIWVLVAIIIAERHGMPHFGIIYAVITFLGGMGMTVGGALFGLLTGFSFDQGPDSTMGFRLILALQCALLLLSAYLIRKTKPLVAAEPPSPEAG